MNFQKTVGMYLGRWRHKKSKYNKIKWSQRPVKALGVVHGYDVDLDSIWLEKIKKIKACLEIWKTRDLTYQGKVLLIKSFVISKIGYEIEMRGIPDKYKKELNDIMWSFIWAGKTNQIKRDVCCLPTERGGMGMINIDSFIKSKHVKSMHKILNAKTDTWNAIGKHWFKIYDQKFNCINFMSSCSDINGLEITNIPKYYRNLITSWVKFRSMNEPESVDEILDYPLFGSAKIQYKGKPLFIQNFAKSGMHKLKDIWDRERKNLKSDNLIFNKLSDKRNWISEWAKIKHSIPKDFQLALKNDTPLAKNTSKLPLRIINSSEICNFQNKILRNKDVPLKLIQNIFNCKTKPISEIKWNTHYNMDLEWNEIWGNIYNNFAKKKANQLSWKITHNIIYTEEKLQKMGRSNGKCFFCKTENETLQHLFYTCDKIKTIWETVCDAINAFLIEKNMIGINFCEKHIILGIHDKNKENKTLNTVLNTVKWVVWKNRNVIKYQKKNLSSQIIKEYVRIELKDLLNCVQFKSVKNMRFLNNLKEIIEQM